MCVKIESAAQNNYTIHMTINQMEKNHSEGYRKFPVQPGEFDVWDKLTVLPEWDGDPAWMEWSDEKITEKLNQFCATYDTKIDPELMQMQVQSIGETW